MAVVHWGTQMISLS